MQILGARIAVDLAKTADTSSKLQAWAANITDMLKLVQKVTMHLGGDLQKKAPDEVLANAGNYLGMLSKVVVSWLWLRQALAAEKGLASTASDNQEEQAFYKGKLQAAQYFIQWELPLAQHDADLLLTRDDTCFAMQKDWF